MNQNNDNNDDGTVDIIDAHTGDLVTVKIDEFTGVVSDEYWGTARWHNHAPPFIPERGNGQSGPYDLVVLINQGFYGFGRDAARKHSVWDLCRSANVSFEDPRLDDFFAEVVARIDALGEELATFRFDYKYQGGEKALRQKWKTLIENRRAADSGDYQSVHNTGAKNVSRLYETQEIVSDYTRLVQTWSVTDFQNNFNRIIQQAGELMSAERRKQLFAMFRETKLLPVRENVLSEGFLRSNGIRTLNELGRVVVSQDNGNETEIQELQGYIESVREQINGLTLTKTDIERQTEQVTKALQGLGLGSGVGQMAQKFDLEQQQESLKKELDALPTKEALIWDIDRAKKRVQRLVPFRKRRVQTEMGRYAPFPLRGTRGGISGMDPVNDYGIQVVYPRDGTENPSFYWKCCGNEGLDHPGCWTGLPSDTQRRPIPYSFFRKDKFPAYRKMFDGQLDDLSEIKTVMRENWQTEPVHGDAFDPGQDSSSKYLAIHQRIRELKAQLGHRVADVAYQMATSADLAGMPWSSFEGLLASEALAALKQLYVLQRKHNRGFAAGLPPLPTTDNEWKRYIEEDLFDLSGLREFRGTSMTETQVVFLLSGRPYFLPLASSPATSLNAMAVLEALTALQRDLKAIPVNDQIQYSAYGETVEAVEALTSAAETYQKLMNVASQIPGASRKSREIIEYDRITTRLNDLPPFMLSEGIPQTVEIGGKEVQAAVAAFTEMYAKTRGKISEFWREDLILPINSLSKGISALAAGGLRSGQKAQENVELARGSATTTAVALADLKGDVENIQENTEKALETVSKDHLSVALAVLDAVDARRAAPVDNSDAKLVAAKKKKKVETKRAIPVSAPVKKEVSRSSNKLVSVPTKKEVVAVKAEPRRSARLSALGSLPSQNQQQTVMEQADTVSRGKEAGQGINELRLVSGAGRVVYPEGSYARGALKAMKIFFDNFAETSSSGTFKVKWPKNFTVSEGTETINLAEIFNPGPSTLTSRDLKKDSKDVKIEAFPSKVNTFPTGEFGTRVTIEGGEQVLFQYINGFQRILDGREFGAEPLRPKEELAQSDRNDAWDFIKDTGLRIGTMTKEQRDEKGRITSRSEFISKWGGVTKGNWLWKQKEILDGSLLRELAVRWSLFAEYILSITAPKAQFGQGEKRRREIRLGYRLPKNVAEKDVGIEPTKARMSALTALRDEEVVKQDTAQLKESIPAAIVICQEALRAYQEAFAIDSFITCLRELRRVFVILRDNSLTQETYFPVMQRMLVRVKFGDGERVFSDVKPLLDDSLQPHFKSFADASFPNDAVYLASVTDSDGGSFLYPEILDIHKAVFQTLVDFMLLIPVGKFNEQDATVIDLETKIIQAREQLSTAWERARQVNEKAVSQLERKRLGPHIVLRSDDIARDALLQSVSELDNLDLNQISAVATNRKAHQFFVSGAGVVLNRAAQVALLLSGIDNPSYNEKQRAVLVDYLRLARIYDSDSEANGPATRTSIINLDGVNSVTKDTINLLTATEMRRMIVILRGFFIAAFVATDESIHRGRLNTKRLEAMGLSKDTKTVFGIPEDGRELQKRVFPIELTNAIKSRKQVIDEIAKNPAATFLKQAQKQRNWSGGFFSRGLGALSEGVRVVTGLFAPEKTPYGTLERESAERLLKFIGRVEVRLAADPRENRIGEIYQTEKMRPTVKGILQIIVNAAQDVRNGWKIGQTQIIEQYAEQVGLRRPPQAGGLWIDDIIWGEEPEVSPSRNPTAIRIPDADTLRRVLRNWALYVRFLLILGSKIAVPDDIKRADLLETEIQEEKLDVDGGSDIKNLDEYIRRFTDQVTYLDGGSGSQRKGSVPILIDNLRFRDASEYGGYVEVYNDWWDFITKIRAQKDLQDGGRGGVRGGFGGSGRGGASGGPSRRQQKPPKGKEEEEDDQKQPKRPPRQQPRAQPKQRPIEQPKSGPLDAGEQDELNELASKSVRTDKELRRLLALRQRTDGIWLTDLDFDDPNSPASSLWGVGVNGVPSFDLDPQRDVDNYAALGRVHSLLFPFGTDGVSRISSLRSRDRNRAPTLFVADKGELITPEKWRSLIKGFVDDLLWADGGIQTGKKLSRKQRGDLVGLALATGMLGLESTGKTLRPVYATPELSRANQPILFNVLPGMQKSASGAAETTVQHKAFAVAAGLFLQLTQYRLQAAYVPARFATLRKTLISFIEKEVKYGYGESRQKAQIAGLRLPHVTKKLISTLQKQAAPRRATVFTEDLQDQVKDAVMRLKILHTTKKTKGRPLRSNAIFQNLQWAASELVNNWNFYGKNLKALNTRIGSNDPRWAKKKTKGAKYTVTLDVEDTKGGGIGPVALIADYYYGQLKQKDESDSGSSRTNVALSIAQRKELASIAVRLGVIGPKGGKWKGWSDDGAASFVNIKDFSEKAILQLRRAWANFSVLLQVHSLPNSEAGDTIELPVEAIKRYREAYAELANFNLAALETTDINLVKSRAQDDIEIDFRLPSEHTWDEISRGLRHCSEKTEHDFGAISQNLWEPLRCKLVENQAQLQKFRILDSAWANLDLISRDTGELVNSIHLSQQYPGDLTLGIDCSVAQQKQFLKQLSSLAGFTGSLTSDAGVQDIGFASRMDDLTTHWKNAAQEEDANIDLLKSIANWGSDLDFKTE